MGSNFYNKYQGLEIKGLPKYARLREALRAAIEDGFWELGSKLPPETKIAQTTPFSLGTVQKALHALVEEGVVVRRQGSGTYISEKRRQMDAPWHCRFAYDEEGFLPVYPKILFRKRITANTSWARLINPNGSNIIQIDRTIGIGNEFTVYSKFFLSGDKFGGFLNKPIEDLESTNFKTILRQEYNIPITHMSYMLRMVHFPNNICRAIEVHVGTLGILDEIVASSGPNNPIYYQELYVPPNNCKLYISDSSNIPEYWT